MLNQIRDVGSFLKSNSDIKINYLEIVLNWFRKVRTVSERLLLQHLCSSVLWWRFLTPWASNADFVEKLSPSSSSANKEHMLASDVQAFEPKR
jgi:hypothetical protein